MYPSSSASLLSHADASGSIPAPVLAPPSALQTAARSGFLLPYPCTSSGASRQIPDSGLPAVSGLSQSGKCSPDTNAPAGCRATARTVQISFLNLVSGVGLAAHTVVDLANITRLVNRLPHLTSETVLPDLANLLIPHLHRLPPGDAVDQPVKQVIEDACIAVIMGDLQSISYYTYSHFSCITRTSWQPSITSNGVTRNSHRCF